LRVLLHRRGSHADDLGRLPHGVAKGLGEDHRDALALGERGEEPGKRRLYPPILVLLGFREENRASAKVVPACP
jgi:hypothetical protein